MYPNVGRIFARKSLVPHHKFLSSLGMVAEGFGQGSKFRDRDLGDWHHLPPKKKQWNAEAF